MEKVKDKLRHFGVIGNGSNSFGHEIDYSLIVYILALSNPYAVCNIIESVRDGINDSEVLNVVPIKPAVQTNETNETNEKA